MALIQSIDSALEKTVGKHGVSADALSGALTRAEKALDWLRARHADGGLPLLNLPETRDELPALRDVAVRFADRATDIVLLGTGGSSLGGQTLAQLAGHAVPGVGALRSGPRLHFMDNLDPESFATLLERLPLATSRFAAISKSGGTGETLMQSIAVLSALQAASLGPRIPDIFLGVSEPSKAGKANGLRDLLGVVLHGRRQRENLLDVHSQDSHGGASLSVVGVVRPGEVPVVVDSEALAAAS